MVAAALIPPNHVQRSSYDQEVSSKLAHGDDPWHFTRNQWFNMTDERHFEPARKLKEALTNNDKNKSDDKWNDSTRHQLRESSVTNDLRVYAYVKNKFK